MALEGVLIFTVMLVSWLCGAVAGYHWRKLTEKP